MRFQSDHNIQIKSAHTVIRSVRIARFAAAGMGIARILMPSANFASLSPTCQTYPRVSWEFCVQKHFTMEIFHLAKVRDQIKFPLFWLNIFPNPD
jgi:hypothetical protein